MERRPRRLSSGERCLQLRTLRLDHLIEQQLLVPYLRGGGRSGYCWQCLGYGVRCYRSGVCAVDDQHN